MPAVEPAPFNLGEEECFASFKDNNNAPNADEIRRIQQEWESFDVLVRFFQHQKAICRGILSPLRRFPPELLGEIFAFAALYPDPFVLKISRKELINLCLVSRGWRDAAYPRHDLWKSLDIPIPFTDDVRLKAQKFLDRSGILPISVSIRAWEPCTEWCVRDVTCSLANPPLAKFLVEGPRLNNLTIRCASSDCVHHLLQSMEKIIPHGQARSWDSVTDLRLTVAYEWDDGEEDGHQPQVASPSTSMKMFSQLPPAITSLYLHLPPCEQDDWDLSLDFPAQFLARLTEFTLICDWGAGAILPVLKSCDNLKTLTLDVGYTKFELEPGNPFQARTEELTTLLTTVRTLSLRNFPPNASAFLNFFRPYELEELDLDFTEDGLDWASSGAPPFSQYFEPFIRRAEEKGTLSLRRLCLCDIESTSEEMRRILLILPALTHLTLSDFSVPSTLFRNLLDFKTAVPLPHLQELNLQGLDDDFQISDVRAYIQGRRNLMMEDGCLVAQPSLFIDGIRIWPINGRKVSYVLINSDESYSDEEEEGSYGGGDSEGQDSDGQGMSED